MAMDEERPSTDLELVNSCIGDLQWTAEMCATFCPRPMNGVVGVRPLALREHLRLDALLALYGYRRIAVPMDGMCCHHSLAEVLRLSSPKISEALFIEALKTGGEAYAEMKAALAVAYGARLKSTLRQLRSAKAHAWQDEAYDAFLPFATSYVRIVDGRRTTIFQHYPSRSGGRPARLTCLTNDNDLSSAAFVRYAVGEYDHIEPCVQTLAGLAIKCFQPTLPLPLPHSSSSPLPALPRWRKACADFLLRTHGKHLAVAPLAAIPTRFVADARKDVVSILTAENWRVVVVMRWEPAKDEWVACILAASGDAASVPGVQEDVARVFQGRRTVSTYTIPTPTPTDVLEESIPIFPYIAVAIACCSDPVHLDRVCRETYTCLKLLDIHYFTALLRCQCGEEGRGRGEE